MRKLVLYALPDFKSGSEQIDVPKTQMPLMS